MKMKFWSFVFGMATGIFVAQNYNVPRWELVVELLQEWEKAHRRKWVNTTKILWKNALIDVSCIVLRLESIIYHENNKVLMTSAKNTAVENCVSSV